MDLKQRKCWNENHKQLTNLIFTMDKHAQAVELFLNQHALLHSSQMSHSSVTTLEDYLLDQMAEHAFRTYPVKVPGTKNSIAWHLWHITRIEDMTMNVLLNDEEQIFEMGNWKERLQVNYFHTGNGMMEEEVADLSSNINLSALLAYRLEVGRRTREIVASMLPGQFNQKVDPIRIKKLNDNGAVKQGESWLLEYWGNKRLGGLILMPATRHLFLHLNKAVRIKEKLQKLNELG
ncbi:DinB family protein [Paenibacillus lutimineralis]|uniref:DinB family protein n=1 Tax=Paenibacillus lutimineralis TaxID=2707005 RepID=A0A3S9UX71_9BACL|nr:DinB family protein [Paenibacillus lutimineralis]AZS14935.1 DinB family protein [Paenibacillus lutimineralis]